MTFITASRRAFRLQSCLDQPLPNRPQRVERMYSKIHVVPVISGSVFEEPRAPDADEAGSARMPRNPSKLTRFSPLCPRISRCRIFLLSGYGDSAITPFATISCRPPCRFGSPLGNGCPKRARSCLTTTHLAPRGTPHLLRDRIAALRTFCPTTGERSPCLRFRLDRCARSSPPPHSLSGRTPQLRPTPADSPRGLRLDRPPRRRLRIGNFPRTQTRVARSIRSQTALRRILSPRGLPTTTPGGGRGLSGIGSPGPLPSRRL